MNVYLFFKALHIIGFVSWFAGIFYLVRLFVYHREAWDMAEPKGSILRRQYHLMEKRLYGIIQTPAMAITIIGGIGMLIVNSSWLYSGWMHLKLALVLALMVYHFFCAVYIKRLEHEKTKWNSFAFRLFNELPTLLLIAIVMLAVWKNLNGLWLGGIILLVLGLLFFAAARLYKAKREK